MAKKRAIIGFAGVALAEVTENTLTSYKSDTANELPFAGQMSRTPKEKTQDVYYDDNIYASIRDIAGEDVEIRLGEVQLALLGSLGLGTYNEATNTFEGDFNVVGKTYSLRCITDTVDHLPYYFNYRIFDLTGVGFDNFQTKGDGLQVCEVIIKGTFSRPRTIGLKPFAIMQMDETQSNTDACLAFVANGETYPKP